MAGGSSFPQQRQKACPNCGQHAPIMLRGIEARCTACGAKRMPFSATSLNLAGQPARIGGIAARVVGCGVGVVGGSLSLGLGLLIQTIFPDGYAGLAVGLPFAIISAAIAVSLFVGGRMLGRSGEEKAKLAKLDTLRTFAAVRGGRVSAAEAAQTLQVGHDEADGLLTELAKDPDANIALDVDDDGRLTYIFGADPGRDRWAELERRARIHPGAAGVRVDAGHDAAATEQAAIDEAATAEAQTRQRR